MDDNCQKLLNELEKINQLLDKTQAKVKGLYNKKAQLRERHDTISPSEYQSEYEALYREIMNVREIEYELLEKKEKIFNELYFVSPPIKSNGIIELRVPYESRKRVENIYKICLCGKRKTVGSISYSGYHTDLGGDVGYGIDEEYQGHGYAYQALCLLGEHLKEHGIDDFWVSAYENNFPSRKTIERYGGEIIETDEGVVVYDAKTKIINESKKSSHTK